MVSLGTRIKTARDRLRLSQQQLADAIGADPKTIYNWEHDITRPSRAMRRLLEDVLGPLTGQPDDLYTLADDIRNGRALTAGQKQALLERLEERPGGRHSLIPASFTVAEL